MGIDIQHEFLIASIKSLHWVATNLWYWGVILIILIGVRIYLAKKYRVFTLDDLADLVVSHLKKGKSIPIIYLNKDTFPKDFEWTTPTEFVFGKFGSIAFRQGNNDNRDAFQLLTEARGEEVRLKKIANLLSISDNQARVTMNNLSDRLQKDSALAPLIDVITTNDGGYRLAIKDSILKQ